MPTVATWWCGQEGPLAYVLDHLDNLVLKPTFPGTRIEPIFGARLSGEAKKAVLDKVRADPGRYVAQEQVALSTVPVWEDNRLGPRHLVLRVYAVPSGSSYVVMPGGLTRISSSLDNMVVSMQSGGGSKDTWVLGDAPAPPFTLLRPATHPLEVSRATFDLPSRVADNLFWLGRYTDRMESVVRLTRAILARFQEGDAARTAGLNAGLKILSELGYLPERDPRRHAGARGAGHDLRSRRAQRHRQWDPSGAPRRVAAAGSHFGGRMADPQPAGSAVFPGRSGRGVSRQRARRIA